MDSGLRELIDAAVAVRESAYAPYSGYRVGAAVRDESGRIHAGCNVENASFGLTICAERAAIFRMVAEGGARVAAVAVATSEGATPCGACRQVLAEFASDREEMQVVCVGDGGESTTYRLSELLPHTFGSQELRRTAGEAQGV